MGSLFSGEWTPHYQVSFHSDSMPKAACPNRCTYGLTRHAPIDLSGCHVPCLGTRWSHSFARLIKRHLVAFVTSRCSIWQHVTDCAAANLSA